LTPKWATAQSEVRLREIGLRCAALPDLDKRSAEEVFGLDEIGVPR
jgi:hypothetical protein